MRPVCSSQVETIGLVRWWILSAQSIPLAATHLIGLLRYCGFGASGDPLADPLPGDPPQSGWITAIGHQWRTAQPSFPCTTCSRA